jgi:TonB family protein
MIIRTGAAVAALAALAAGAAGAQQITTFSQAPSAADIAAAYPAKAKAAGVGGMANLSCQVGYDGHPRDCVTLGEAPDGYGFGFAARKLATKLKVAEAGMTGKEVRVPFTFDPGLAKGQAPTITKPEWQALPSPQDFQSSFPKAANGVNDVRVALVCSVAAGGALGGCAVDREEPAGMGYGQGALALAPKFKVGPWSRDGLPTTGAKVRVPIHYQLTQAEAPKG